MNEFKVIEVMNQAMLETKKEKNKNYQENQRIQELLKDEAYFFKIDKLNSIEILKNVGVKEDKIEEVYKKLTSSKVYYDLLQQGKIKENDETLVIKYDTYRKYKFI